jgi:hypothetical protein
MEYGVPPFPLTQRFFEDGRQHGVLGTPLAVPCPVRILQGMQDPDVPWRHALAVAETIQSPDLTLTFIKAGDHRLSTPADLERLTAQVQELMSAASPSR